ncbi:hypothetical protein ANN_17368 [Periplaneta americana]|uniref:Uncharacterized protein n=1 Tax=Periplaneta americana TaxID=6978 RepID=A0ABQ8SSR1_PERAM|nr:hypothetical protein ANN_17368 [Periplaneta americana]
MEKLTQRRTARIIFFTDIIRSIKSRRLRWTGHVARMGESRNAYRVLVGRPEGKRPLERPRRRWEENIKLDLRECAPSKDVRTGDPGGHIGNKRCCKILLKEADITLRFSHLIDILQNQAFPEWRLAMPEGPGLGTSGVACSKPGYAANLNVVRLCVLENTPKVVGSRISVWLFRIITRDCGGGGGLDQHVFSAPQKLRVPGTDMLSLLCEMLLYQEFFWPRQPALPSNLNDIQYCYYKIHCHNPGDLRNYAVKLTGFLEFGKDATTLPPRGFDGSLSILLNEGCDWLLTGEDKISVTVRKTFIYDNQLVVDSRRGDFLRRRLEIFVSCMGRMPSEKALQEMVLSFQYATPRTKVSVHPQMMDVVCLLVYDLWIFSVDRELQLVQVKSASGDIGMECRGKTQLPHRSLDAQISTCAHRLKYTTERTHLRFLSSDKGNSVDKNRTSHLKLQISFGNLMVNVFISGHEQSGFNSVQRSSPRDEEVKSLVR